MTGTAATYTTDTALTDGSRVVIDGQLRTISSLDTNNKTFVIDSALSGPVSGVPFAAVTASNLDKAFALGAGASLSTGKIVNVGSTYGTVTADIAGAQNITLSTALGSALSSNPTYSVNTLIPSASFNHIEITNATATIAGTGLTTGDQATVVLAPLAGAYSSSTNLRAGSYLLNVGNGSTAGANFSSMVVVGNLTVTPKTLTIGGITTSSKEYDGNNVATVSTAVVTKSGLIDSDVVVVSASGVFSDKHVALDGSNAVTSKTVTLTSSYSGADLGNYTIIGQPTTTATITPKALTVSGITAANKTYDGTTAATVNTTGALFSGLVSGDDLSVTSTGTFGTKLAAAGKTVTLSSSYAGTDKANYTISDQTSTTATITPAPLTVTATAVTKTYDGTTGTNGAKPTIGTLVSGDVVNAPGSEVFADKNAGTSKTVNASGVSIKDGGGSDVSGSYSITYVPNTSSTIDKAALTITGITASDKIYDGTNTATANTTNVSMGGLITNDVVNVSATGTFSDKNVAISSNVATSKTVTLASTYSGADAGNYSIADQTSTTATISKATLTISSVSAADKVYDGSTSANVTVSGSGVIAGDTVTVSGNGNFRNADNSANDKNVAYSNSVVTSKPVNVSVALSGTDAGNYSIPSTTSTTATITQRPLAVTYAGVTKVYDGTTAATVTTSDDRVANDTFTINRTAAFDNTGSTGKNVGIGKTVNVSGVSLSSGDAANYSVSATGGTVADITPAPLTITASTDSKTYDGSTASSVAPTITSGTIKTAAGDSITGTLTQTFDSKNASASGGRILSVSPYTINDGNSGNNYAVTLATASGTINQASLTVTALPDSRTYDGTAYSGGVGVAFGVVSNGVTSHTFVGGEDASNLAGTLGYSGTSQGAINAGSYDITPQGLTSNNYALTFVGGQLAIGGANLISGSLTGTTSKVYDGTNGATLSPSNYLLTGWVGSDSATVTKTSGTYTTTSAGDNKTVTVSLASGDFSASQGTVLLNYTLPSSVSGAIGSITAKALTMSGLSVPASKTYDGSLAAVVTGTPTLQSAIAAGSGTAIDGKPYSGDTVAISGTATGTYNSKNVVGASSVDYSGLALNNSNYSLTLQSPSAATITAKTLTVSGSSAAGKTYDGNTGATITGGTLAGFVGIETVTASATGTFDSQNAGSRSATAAYTLADGSDGGLASNYSLANSSGLAATINPKALSVSASSAAGKQYDGNTNAAITVGTLSGFVSSETVTATASGTFDSKAVGSRTATARYTLANGTNSGLAANYSLADTTGLSATISPKALTISGITVSDKVYDGRVTADVSTAGVTSSVLQTGGMVAGDEVTVLATGNFRDAGNTNNDKNVAFNVASNISVSSGGSGYTSAPTVAISGGGGSGATATAVVANGVVTGITITNAGSGYTSTPTITLSGGNGVGATAAGALAVTSKPVALTSSYGGADVGNYTITDQTSSAAKITPKTMTISGISAANKIYNGTTAATVSTTGVTATVLESGGMVSGDNVTVSATGLFDNKNVGDAKTVNLTSSYGGTDRANYTITDQATTTANITPKALAITGLEVTITGITAADKVYDGTRNATVSTQNVVYTGLVTGDQLTVAATGLFDTKNVGSGKTVALSSSYTGADVFNYNITDQATTTASITPKSMSVSGITAASKPYDGNAVASISTGGAAYSGLVSGDSVSVSASGNFSDKNVGSGKTVTLASTYGGADVGNYTITGQGSTSADITQKSLTISGIAAASKVYDGGTAATVSTGSAAYEGLVSGDALAVSASGTFNDKNVGVGKTVALVSSYSGADVGNYTITDQSSTSADVSQKALSVSGITADSKIYDANRTARANTGSAVYTGLVTGDKFAVFATGLFDTKNVGVGKTVTLSSSYSGIDVGNYSITNQTSTSADITPKGVVVSGIVNIAGITAANKVYDGTTSASVSTQNATYAGLIAGDDMKVSATGTFSDKNVGVGKTVTLLSSYDGADAANYVINDQASTTANITPKPLMVSGITTGNKVYDGTRNASVSTQNVIYAGLVSGDTLAVAATGQFDNKTVGTGKAVALSSSYSGADVGNYSITNQASTTANVTPKALVISGITAANKVYDGSTTASVSTAGVTEAGLVAGDVVNVAAIGTFNDKNVGTGKSVTFTSSYSGADVGNYNIANQASSTANIASKALTLSDVSASNKTYDGLTDASITLGNLVGLVSGESIGVSGVGKFVDPNVGMGKTVNVKLALANGAGGGLASNYVVSDTSTKADINPVPSTVAPLPPSVASVVIPPVSVPTPPAPVAVIANTSTPVDIASTPASTPVASVTSSSTLTPTPTSTSIPAAAPTGTSIAVGSSPASATGSTAASTGTVAAPSTEAPATTSVAVTPAGTSTVMPTATSAATPATATSNATPVPVNLNSAGDARVSASSAESSSSSAASGNASGTGGFISVRSFDATTVSTGSAFSFTLPKDTFQHADARATVALEARMADGKALPIWLNFDPASARFTGNAPRGVPEIVVRVIARDGSGGEASTQVTLRFNASSEVR